MDDHVLLNRLYESESNPSRTEKTQRVGQIDAIHCGVCAILRFQLAENVVLFSNLIEIAPILLFASLNHAIHHRKNPQIQKDMAELRLIRFSLAYRISFKQRIMFLNREVDKIEQAPRHVFVRRGVQHAHQSLHSVRFMQALRKQTHPGIDLAIVRAVHNQVVQHRRHALRQLPVIE